MNTQEEEIKLLKVAHGRMHNQLKTLLKDFETLKNKWSNDKKQLIDTISDLKDKLDEVKPSIKERFILPFKVDNQYLEEISEIISKQEVIWNKKKYFNYCIKLKQREEIYLLFLSEDYIPEVGRKILFTYDGTNQLRKAKFHY